MIGTGGVIIFADEDDSDSLRGFNDTGGDTELFPDDDDNGTAENPTGLALLIDDDDVDDDGNFVGSLFVDFSIVTLALNLNLNLNLKLTLTI